MRTVADSMLVLCTLVCTASVASAQAPVGALAVDERQGERYGWAVDYETAGAAQATALNECGGGCRVVLTFERCAAYAADQAAHSTAVGWAESFASSSSVRQASLSACSSRGGTGCIVRVWGCNGPVVEEGLGLDRAARQQIQRGLQAAGFEPGGADGVFGPRTRAAIRRWQTSRGSRATGYLDGPSVAALRPSALGQPRVRRREPAGPDSAPPADLPAAQQRAAAVSAELEGLFWQSIMDSANPAEFEAHLAQFPNGVFRSLAEARLAALLAPAGAAGGPGGDARPPASNSKVSRASAPASGPRLGGAPGPGMGAAADANRSWQPGTVFRDCDVCPEMVVIPGGLALGRYEVTVGEYRAFASRSEAGPGSDLWRDHPGFPQTDRHPVTRVSWKDAQGYLSWLSGTAGATYRLPTEAEWERAAAGSQRGCDHERTGNLSTCTVGSYGANAAGLSDMVGNLWEWTEDCWEGDCGLRVARGGSWLNDAEYQRPGSRARERADYRNGNIVGFRVARMLGAP